MGLRGNGMDYSFLFSPIKLSNERMKMIFFIRKILFIPFFFLATLLFKEKCSFHISPLYYLTQQLYEKNYCSLKHAYF